MFKFKMGKAETKKWVSAERTLLKSIRFGVAYGKSDSIINLQTDYSPEDMMVRYKAVFEQKR